MTKPFLLLLLAGIGAGSQAWAEPPAATPAPDSMVYGEDFFFTFSPTPVELPADSALRRELFDGIRRSIPTDHKFEGSLKVYRNWAFFGGVTVDARGKVFYYPDGGSASAALWLRTRDGGREIWKLVDAVFGAPYDLPYKTWPYRYGAPYLLLGLDPTAGQSGTNLLP